MIMMLQTAKVTAVVLLVSTLIPGLAVACGEFPAKSCPQGAPNDHDSYCRLNFNTRLQHIFPDNWRLLVDTYDYQDLYSESPGAVWINKDFDSDYQQWLPFVGGSCTYSLYTCSYHRAPQNNWLFSQYICLHDAKEIFFNVSYTFTQCSHNPACQDDSVTLYRYDVNSTVSTQDRINPNNYVLLNSTNDLEDSRLRQGNSHEDVAVLRSILRPQPQQNGFYLGVHDRGTCGQVNRIIAYYTVCSSRSNGLVNYPEFSCPPKDGPDMEFHAVCKCNAHSVTSLKVIASASDCSCRDEVLGGAKCACNPGYETSRDGTSCILCPAGTYRAPGGKNMCAMCPAYTRTDLVGAVACPCLDGYYRDNQPLPLEGPEADCKAPPGPPKNVAVAIVTHNSITLTWSCTTGTGVFYQVCYLTSDSEGHTCYRVDSNECNVTHTITGLEPVTTYSIDVCSNNMVSDQDPNKHLRVVEVVASTTEGVPSCPSLKRLCTVCIWEPPTKPVGIITSYEICLGNCSHEMTCFNISYSDSNFLLTSHEQRLANVGVKIRARNSAFTGPFCECNPIGCPMLQCPAQSLTVTDVQTTPTVPAVNASCGEVTCTLRGVTVNNGSTLKSSDIGEDEDALICRTSNDDCCKRPARGECYGPDGSSVARKMDNEKLYRNRGNQVIRLNGRQYGNTPLMGVYRCCLPNECDEDVCFHINLVEE